MKKLMFLLLIPLLVLVSCSGLHSVKLNDDNTLTVDSAVYYPLENSYRFTDYGKEKKIGAVFGGNVWAVNSDVPIVLVEYEKGDTYYVTEEYRGFDKIFEECSEYFFVPEKDLDKDGRINKSYLAKANKLTGQEAEDFNYSVCCGRPPEELGYKGGKYIGNIYGVFYEFDSLVSCYPVYEYSPTSHSVELDGEEYVLEIKWARDIGIIE